MIPVYQPQLQLYLHKTVQRKTTNGKDAVSERFSGSAKSRRVDLLKFVGEGSSVRTSKSVREPAGGFQLALVDRPGGDAGSFESMYGLVEPMDMVEIRMRHGAPGDASDPPIVMRGFVSNVARGEVIGADGKPQRAVLISGEDYGKVWQIVQIVFHAAYLVGKSLLSGFSLFELYGVEPKTTQTSKEFFEAVIDKIINPYLDGLLPAESELPRAITADVAVTSGTVSPAIQTQQGTIYELLRHFGDVGPWNEMFTEDREDGVFAVYRPAPLLDATSGELIQDDAPEPVYIDVGDEDVLSLNASRTDANISNFFWVSAPRFNLVRDIYQKQQATAAGNSTVVLDKYENTATKLYGIRLMMLETAQGPTDTTTQNSGAKADEHQQLQQKEVEWMDERRRIVVDSNKDNVVFERGTMRLRGNESIRAGCYVRLRRGDTEAIYYAVDVSHEYIPYSGFYTAVTFERGTGFVERIRSEGSPYLAELTNL